MAEEPIPKEEWSEDDEAPREGLADRMRSATKTLREKFAKGGVFVFAVFFVFGVLFGVAAKAVAARSILIGYWDYTVSPRDKAAVNLNAVQHELLAQQADEAKKQEDAAKAAENAAGAGANGANGANGSDVKTNGDESSSELPPLPPAPAPPEGVTPQGNQ
jgi:hypothetical protein